MNEPSKKARVAGLLLAGGLALAGCGGSEGSAAAIGEPVTVVESGATHPSTALDPRDGRAYVAWIGGEPGEYGVYLSSAGAGGGEFGPPVRVNDVPGDAAPHEQAPAQVAVGPGGEVYVLWQNNTPVEGRRFPASDLRFAVSTDGGRTFSAAITVNDDAGGVPSSHTFHDVAVAADGTIVVSWIDSRDQDARRVGAEHEHSGEPPAETTSDIRVARSTDGGRSFSPGAIVDENPCPCCRTAMALGGDGSVYVAWRKVYPGDVRDVVVARARAGGLDFEEPVRVGDDQWVYSGCPHAGPALAVGADDRLHVGWYTGRPERQGLWYATSADRGRTFGAPRAIQTGEWVPPALVSIAERDGEVLVAWDDRTADAPVVRIARILGGAPVPVGRAEPGRAPAFDAGGGAAFLAWSDGEAIRGSWAGRTE